MAVNHPRFCGILDAAVTLPVDSLRDDLLQALDDAPVVVSAPTGSGKSTRVPAWCARRGQRVLVVEPRRVACRSLARFVAAQMDTRPGGEVGYRHRHEDRSGPDTRLLYVTPGTALNMFHATGLEDFDVVILDEFHERHLHVDLLLALLRASPASRSLAIMSATVDASWLADQLGGRPLTSGGRLHPVSIEYDPHVSVPTHRDLATRMSRAVRRGLGFDGDVLVFLPGKAEIAALARELGSLHGVQVLVLHGELDTRKQDLVFTPGRARRVILSTNVAESAVTLPGIGVVVDSGLERRMVYRDGRSVLELCVISADSADQRAGRAGRLAPGVALRCWSQAARLEPHAVPEIHRVDLTDMVMQAAFAGHRPEDLPLVDPPRRYALDEAVADLVAMSALDEDHVITSTGRRMMRFALEPRLSRLLVLAQEDGTTALLQDMVDLVASLSVGRDLFVPAPEPGRFPAREEYEQKRCDLYARVHAMRLGDPARHGLRAGPIQEARKVASTLRRKMGLGPAGEAAVERVQLSRAVLRAWPWSGFVPHRRAGAFGNGRREVVLGRESFVSSSARALVVVQRRSVKKGRRTVTLATCAGPVEPVMLARAGQGEQVLAQVRREGTDLVGTIHTTLGPRIIDVDEKVLAGPLAAQAASLLIQKGEVLPGVWEELLDHVQAHNLDRALRRRGGREVDAGQWLTRRLMKMGVTSGQDLELVSEQDLRYEDIDPARKRELDRDYPRTLAIQAQVLRASYDPGKRVVTLQYVSGDPRSAPSDLMLPAWTGYKVLYVDRGRTTRVR